MTKGNGNDRKKISPARELKTKEELQRLEGTTLFAPGGKKPRLPYGAVRAAGR